MFGCHMNFVEHDIKNYTFRVSHDYFMSFQINNTAHSCASKDQQNTVRSIPIGHILVLNNS